MLLQIKNLHTIADDKEILKGINLNINKGEIHVIMGPNGAGKTTLANAIFSHPHHKKTCGEIIFDGENITNLKTDEIAKKGIFMSFQTPEEIEGISLFNFIKQAKSKTNSKIDYFELSDEIEKNIKSLKIKQGMESRDLNVGCSGGEKKKNEILQMLELNPKLAILDETDSGLDVDAIKIVSKGIGMFSNKNNAMLIITHSTKLLESIPVDYVHILVDGKIVYTGDASLANEIDKHGYSKFVTEAKNA